MNVSQSMLARPDVRLAMLAGSCTVWSMASSPMAIFQLKRTRVSRTMKLSIPSSVRLDRENTFLVPSSSTSSRQLLVRETSFLEDGEDNDNFDGGDDDD